MSGVQRARWACTAWALWEILKPTVPAVHFWNQQRTTLCVWIQPVPKNVSCVFRAYGAQPYTADRAMKHTVQKFAGEQHSLHVTCGIT